MKTMTVIVALGTLFMSGAQPFAQPETDLETPITLDAESIISDGFIPDQSPEDSLNRQLEAVLDDILSVTGCAGVSAAVGVPGKGVWCSSRGTTGNESQRKLTPDRMLYAGSIGKIYTAAMVLRLIDEGLLSLDDTIEQWFPDVVRAGEITVDHLLAHTSGIPSFDNLEDYQANKGSLHDPEDIMDYINGRDLLFEPGRHYSYCNTGYLMLGLIIEDLTTGSYNDAIEKYIIDELNLRETDLLTPEPRGRFVARGHHAGEVLASIENYFVPSAAGSIVASPKDLVLFFQKLMSGQTLSDRSFEAMFTDMNLTTMSHPVYYGKGVVAILDTPIGGLIGHTGSIRGFGAVLYYQPDENIFVAVMMNDDVQPVMPAVFRLMETVISAD